MAAGTRITLSSKFFARMAALTAINAHGDCLQEAAAALGLNHLAEQLGRINRAHEHAGYLTSDIAAKRQRAKDHLRLDAKGLLSAGQHDQLFRCI